MKIHVARIALVVMTGYNLHLCIILRQYKGTMNQYFLTKLFIRNRLPIFPCSVQDLVKRINSHNNQLRSTPFIGQSGAQGLKQKKQLETVAEFKKGTFNVLVATCVGEEGLDIG